MSRKYKHTEDVPSSVLCARLRELSDAVTKGADSINREFYMRIPAEPDNDADLVLHEAARRIEELESFIQAARHLSVKLHEIFDSDEFQGVFTMAFIRGHEYAGPSLENELTVLDSKLKAFKFIESSPTLD